MRLVIELKRGEVPEVVLNNLYKQTQLQDTFGINMVALIDGQPKLCNLKDLITVFLEHRREVVTRRTVFELRKARERGHVLEGLAVALANIDEFIKIIRESPTPPVAKAELMTRSWDSQLVREMLTRAKADGGTISADDYRPEGLEREFGMQADGPLPPQRNAGAGNPANASAAPDRPGAGQDRRRVQGRDGRHRRPAGHPGQARACLDHHQRRTGGGEDGVWPDQAGRPPQRNRTQRAGPVDRRPDHTDRHGCYLVSQRLHQEPAFVRIPRPEARWAWQAGDSDQGRRLDRPALHCQHARLHPVLLQPRPPVLAQGLGSAGRFARLAWPPHRQHVPAAGRRKRSTWCCR